MKSPYRKTRTGVLGAGLVGASILAGAATGALAGPRAAVMAPRPAPTRFQAAIDSVIAESPEPERARASLMARLHASMGCYRGDMTDEEYRLLVQRTQLLPPTLQGGGNTVRYFTDTQVWLGDGTIGPAKTSRRANLTYSFPPDGTIWGISCQGTPASAPSTLDAAMINAFTPSPQPLDRGREYIRSALAAWRRVGGLSYQEVADNGEAMNGSTTRSASRGDIRIGGYAMGTGSGLLAYNMFPSTGGYSACPGGDMVINTSYFTPAYFTLPVAKFLYFRNTIAHEHGHGLGMRHAVPCDQTKLMEPVISTANTLLMPDDIRGAIVNYNDRFAPNHSTAAAKDFGTLTGRSVLERDLGTNGASVNIGGMGVAQDDYFKFTLASAQSVTVSVTPTGVLGDQGTQTSGCNGTTEAVDGSRAGHLQLQLRNSSSQVIGSATSAPVGSPQSLTQTLNAGTYYVRVWDLGDNWQSNPTAQAQKVQVYDLLIRVGSHKAPPQAIAGINKLARAGQVTYFMGDLNSRPTEAGATIPSTGYEWDLDGNGSFETVGVAQPTITYLSNGVYVVTLRVTDDNGMQGTDSITCTVTGATTSITSCAPSSANQGTSVPVTINGTNLKAVTTLSQITVSGSGVTVTGTPVPNAMGTQITGVSFTVAGAAATGARNIVVTGADGPGSTVTGTGVFTVTAVSTQGACCASDGGCTTTTQSACQSAGGVYQGNSTSCSPNPCPQPSACCFGNGSCTFVLASACAGSGGSSQAGSCNPNPCPQPTGACCPGDGSCTVVTQSACTGGGGSYQGNGASCSPNPCPQPTGACCASGSCSVGTTGQCLASGGSYQGNGTLCNPNPCPQPTGACCAGATCSVTLPGACTGANRRFVGAGVACNVAGNKTTPCCYADFNQLSGTTVQDMFDFLAAWFAQNSMADANGTGTVTNQDLFDFMAAWFAGCGS